MSMYFDDLIYDEYLKTFPFHEALGIDLASYGAVDNKVSRPIFQAVDPKHKTPYPVELDDLVRLHYLVTSRKVATVMEFGVGKSTAVFNHALLHNEVVHGEFFRTKTRAAHPFKCFSIDDSQHWIEVSKSSFGHLPCVNFHFSVCRMTTFNDRACTMYDNLPNICPDLIYLDAPHQSSPLGDVSGISTNQSDRMPMAADILLFEHFLVPGTLIVVDGRTANARFLHTNLQRNWRYDYVPEFDQHFFELRERPLGRFNQAQIAYCLGGDWCQGK